MSDSEASKITIEPLFGRVLVQPIEEENDKGGIIIPPTAQSEEQPEQGVVVRLGTGKKDENGNEVPFTVKVGDKVFFKKYSPDEIEVNGERFLIIEESDILAIIR